MTYLDGFVLAVPTASKQRFIEHASTADAVFKEHGAIRIVEAWGDDVPRGKLNDFYGAVQAGEDETVAFSWIEWPDKATRDSVMGRMEELSKSDERVSPEKNPMPFDGKRMIYGGFETIVDEGGGRGDYVDGIVLPVPTGNKEAYRQMSLRMAPFFLRNGAVRYVEGWGDDVPAGKQTDYRRAAHATDGETVVHSYIEWPSKEVRDAAWQQIMTDESMQPSEAERDVFDGKRMFWGGFRPVVDIADPAAEG